MLPSNSRVLFSFYFLIENRQNSKSSEKCFRIPQIVEVLCFKSPLSSRSKWGTVLYSNFISLVFVSVYMCYCMWNLCFLFSYFFSLSVCTTMFLALFWPHSVKILLSLLFGVKVTDFMSSSQKHELFGSMFHVLSCLAYFI